MVQFILKVPIGENIISGHTLHKFKHNYDGSLKLKYRIAPYGNEDNLKEVLNKYCSTCPQMGLIIVESIASLNGWTFYKVYVKSVFLQTGKVYQYVYVYPPRESMKRETHMWLLLTAGYGLDSSNAKFQNKSH